MTAAMDAYSRIACKWCGNQNDTRVFCGAPLDAKDMISQSGWRDAPRLRDMTEIRFDQSTCQVEGELESTPATEHVWVKLYGTTTSPVRARRVRVVAEEVGEPVDRIDTATEAGMAALRAISPIHKVPIAIVDERPIFDSRAIIAWLVTSRGWHDLARAVPITCAAKIS